MHKLLNQLGKYWLFSTLLILTTITTLSLWPLESLPAVPGTDKTHHFIAYGALMLPTALKKPKYWLLITLLFVICSGAIELFQPYVNRYGEFEDMIANISGLACGLIVAEILKRLFPADSSLK
ncbi:MAG: VanZ family protein [Cyanobacteria bacterium J06635_13]